MKKSSKKLIISKQSVIISNPNKIQNLKKVFTKDGPNKLHILSDFDRTLTNAFLNGEEAPTLISMLGQKDCLPENYRIQAQQLYAYYRPIEKNPKISSTDKKLFMHQWWIKHFQLLINSGLTKLKIIKAIQKSKIHFRKDCGEFLGFLNKKNIPIIIISSGGIEEMIFQLLKKYHKLHNNTHIITNKFNWSKSGKALGIKEPIIHSMNKDDTLLKDYPKIFNIIHNKTNVILLGDTLGDAGMIKGFNYTNLIKIGFLNENIQENIDQYKKVFDIVLTGDSSMDYINKLLYEIIQ